MDFKEKLKSIQFSKVQTKTVKDKETGQILGEQHYHLNGSVGATVMPATGGLSVNPETGVK